MLFIVTIKSIYIINRIKNLHIHIINVELKAIQYFFLMFKNIFYHFSKLF